MGDRLEGTWKGEQLDRGTVRGEGVGVREGGKGVVGGLMGSREDSEGDGSMQESYGAASAQSSE